jgi:uncharacterized protein YjbJ (UPF0337 family)
MKGNVEKAKGHAKQAMGDLTGNKKLKNEGKVDVAAGKVKQVVEGATRKVDKTADKIMDRLSKN